MLIKCIECNHEVSEYAEMCPHCGCPIDKIKEGLQTDVVSVEDVKETDASTSFDVSKTICPVCKNECESGAEICPICGFDELHKEFISKEDGNLWLETVVIPYRTEWENSQVDLSDFEIEGTVLKKYKGNAEYVSIPRFITEIDKAFYGNEKLKNIFIPDSVGIIGKRAFCGCRGLTKVIMPNSVECVGDEAFSKCISLTEIIISASVTKIEHGAFDGCEKLSQIVIPESVTSIGDFAFSGCINLRKIKMPSSVIDIGKNVFKTCIRLLEIYVDLHNPKYYSEDGVLYSKDKSCIITVPAGRQEIIIPYGVTNIYPYAFNSCSNLIKITIPDSVTCIGEKAFEWCKSLKELIIPNSVTCIGNYAFNHCDSLSEIRIPNSVTELGNSVYNFCANLKKVYIPKQHKIGKFIFGNPDLEIIRY